MIIISNGIKWLLRNFFFIVIAILTVSYIRARWYQPLHEEPIILFFWISANILVTIGLRIFTLRSWVGWIFLVVLLFALFINAFFVYLFAQIKVIASAEYNGIQYFIVEHMTWDSWESPYSLEKWCGHQLCGSYSLKSAPDMGFFYESESNLVHVVGRYENEEWLIFTDSNPTRRYERYPVDFMNHRFYRTIKCTKWEKDLRGYDHCPVFRLTVFECELDNTDCIPISQYEGMEGESYFEISDTSNEMDLFVFTTGEDILIYSYGDHPRCHVEGCEILQP